MKRYACARAAMAGVSDRTASAFSRSDGLWAFTRTSGLSAWGHTPMTLAGRRTDPNLTIPDHGMPRVLWLAPPASDTGRVTPFSQPSFDLFVSSIVAGLKRAFGSRRRAPRA